MSAIFELDAEMRSDVRRGASRRLRHAGLVPAIVYGGDAEPLCIKLSHNTFMKALKYKAFYSHVLTLLLGDRKESVILKALQRHPYKKEILHIDFLRVQAGEKLTMSVPLNFVGDKVAPGIKNGGTLLRQLTEVEVECLPGNLPESIDVDVSQLGLNKAVYLSDLKLPEGVELIADLAGEDQNLAIASIQQIAIQEDEAVSGPVETEILTAKPDKTAKEND